MNSSAKIDNRIIIIRYFNISIFLNMSIFKISTDNKIF